MTNEVFSANESRPLLPLETIIAWSPPPPPSRCHRSSFQGDKNGRILFRCAGSARPLTCSTGYLPKALQCFMFGSCLWFFRVGRCRHQMISYVEHQEAPDSTSHG